MSIEAIHGSLLAPLAEAREDVAPKASPATSFGDLMVSAIRDTAAAENAADTKVQALAEGSLDDIHGTMIASKQAEISLHLIGTIRNKLLDAFHEIWRTGI